MDILFDREYLVEEPLSTRRRKDISIWRSVARRPMTLQFFNLTVRWQMISRRLSDFHVSRLFLVRENNTQVLVVGLVACYQDRDRFQQFDVDSTSNAFRFDRSKHTHTHTRNRQTIKKMQVSKEKGELRELFPRREACCPNLRLSKKNILESNKLHPAVDYSLLTSTKRLVLRHFELLCRNWFDSAKPFKRFNTRRSENKFPEDQIAF